MAGKSLYPNQCPRMLTVFLYSVANVQERLIYQWQHTEEKRRARKIIAVNSGKGLHKASVLYIAGNAIVKG